MSLHITTCLDPIVKHPRIHSSRSSGIPQGIKPPVVGSPALIKQQWRGCLRTATSISPHLTHLPETPPRSTYKPKTPVLVIYKRKHVFPNPPIFIRPAIPAPPRQRTLHPPFSRFRCAITIPAATGRQRRDYSGDEVGYLYIEDLLYSSLIKHKSFLLDTGYFLCSRRLSE